MIQTQNTEDCEYLHSNLSINATYKFKTSCIPLQHFQFVPNCITMYNHIMCDLIVYVLSVQLCYSHCYYTESVLC